MRQDQWSDTVTIDGVPSGIWDEVDGGEVDSGETKYRPGGMQPQVSLGGSTTVGNLTLTRLLDQPRDWDFMRRLMQSRTGKAPAVVSRQPLDRDGNPFGRPLIYRGVLKTVTPPKSNSNSEEAGTWQIVVSTEGTVG